MKRLTRKVDGTYVPRNKSFIMGNIACTKKLGKLEDLEEQRNVVRKLSQSARR